MKFLLSSAIMLMLCNRSSAQTLTWQWAKSGTQAFGACDVVALPDGSSVVAGNYLDSIRLGGQTIRSISGSKNGSFIAGYAPSGALQFLKDAGRFGDVRSVARDDSGNIFTVGQIIFDSVVFGQTALKNRGSVDMYVACFDAAGTFRWAKSIGGKGNDECDQGSIATVLGAAGVVLHGMIKDTFWIDTLKVAATTYQPLLARFTSSGELMWYRTINPITGPSNANNGAGGGVSTDLAGNIYTTGVIKGSIDFGSGVLSGDRRPYFAKYRQDGSLAWVRHGGGDAGNSYTGSSKVVAGASDLIYFTGHSERMVSSAALTLGNWSLPPCEYYAVAIDSAGNWKWVQYGSGTRSFTPRPGIDASGDLYLAGSFMDSLTRNGTTAMVRDSGQPTGYILKFKHNGILDWKQRIDGLSYNAIGGLNIDPNFSVHIAGQYSGRLEMGATILEAPYSTQNQNFYLAKLNQTLASPPLVPVSEILLIVHPVPSTGWLSVTVPITHAGLPIKVYSMDGKLVLTQYTTVAEQNYLLDLTAFSSGVYWLHFAGIDPVKVVLLK